MAGTWTPVEKALPMSKPIIRYLRLHCPTSMSVPQPSRDGPLAVAAINEDAQLAQMLLVDMRRWDRNAGASVRDALGVLVVAAHRRLVAGFGISLADTSIVEWDGADAFFRLRVDGVAARRGLEDAPACATRCGDPLGRSSFLAWAGPTGAAMLQKVEAVVGRA
jgi:hypothetical protein